MTASRFLFLAASVAAFAFGAAGGLSAQIAATLESGASRTTPADGTALTSTAVGATVSLLRPWTSAGASLSWSRFADDGGTILQGSAGASTFSGELLRRIRFEASISGSVVTSDPTTSARLAPSARLHLLGERAGTWIGSGYGLGRGADSTRGIATAEAAAWFRQGPLSVTALGVPTWIAGGRSYTDAALSGRFERGGVDLLGTVGTRREEGRPSQSWASLSLAAWITDQLAILASGGRYPDDPIQAFSGGRFLSVGLRIATRRPDRIAVAVPRTAADLRPVRPDGPIGISVEAAAAGFTERLIRVTAPGAAAVELQGDATAWAPLAMEQERPGIFVLRLPLAAGPQHLVIRVDGGRWMVPAGTTRVEDEFGTASGLLVVQ